VRVLECALTLVRDLAYIWPRCPHPILSVCNSSINKANRNKPLVVFNIKEPTGSQESDKKKKKKRKQPDQLIIFTLYLPLRMPVKPIILPQLINIIKVNYQSYDNDKEECNAVANKELFKLTNWFLNLGINGHFCYNTDYFI
jgi:hypothetical protein